MILLVRHGETEWNLQRRFQGRRDSPLTELGRRQAEAVARLIHDLMRREAGAWRLVASPLGRTRATASLIAAATGLPVETDPRLMEVDCGEWEGRTWAEAGGGREGPARQWIFDAPGGETLDQVRGRIADFLAGLPPEPERRVIVVSHGAAGRVLRGVYAGVDLATVLDLDSPQDAVWRLLAGQVDRFDCEPLN